MTPIASSKKSIAVLGVNYMIFHGNYSITQVEYVLSRGSQSS